jgi:hypothetical protein
LISDWYARLWRAARETRAYRLAFFRMLLRRRRQLR